MFVLKFVAVADFFCCVCLCCLFGTSSSRVDRSPQFVARRSGSLRLPYARPAPAQCSVPWVSSRWRQRGCRGAPMAALTARAALLGVCSTRAMIRLKAWQAAAPCGKHERITVSARRGQSSFVVNRTALCVGGLCVACASNFAMNAAVVDACHSHRQCAERTTRHPSGG